MLMSFDLVWEANLRQYLIVFPLMLVLTGDDLHKLSLWATQPDDMTSVYA
jgi:hypothetical protein